MSAPALPAVQQIGALVALVSEQRLREAEQGARALIGTYPDAGMLWKILSVALVRQGKEALPELRRAAQHLPQDAEAHCNLGAALYDRGEWEEALTSLRRALELQPQAVQPLIDAANALRALGRARESLALYERALQLEPGAREAHNNLGNAFLELGEPGKAVSCYRRALESKPNDAQVLCNLGNALRQLGQFAEAIGCSQRAIALEPGLSKAYNNLGLSLAGLGRRREAVASYRQALYLSPHDVEALNNLGNALRGLGEHREALSRHRRAAELDPHRADTHCNLGNVLFDLRHLEEAAGSFRRALALRADYPQALLGLATVLRIQGLSAEAEASCRSALTIDPTHVEAWVFLGELCADRGQFAQAQAQFEHALAIDAGLPSAYCGLVAHRKVTSADAAWLQGVQALLTKPLPLEHEINLRYALGKYFDDLGHYDEAFGNYRQANELTRRYGRRHDRLQLTRRVDRIIATFDPQFIRQCHSGVSVSELPVLIVGMPRSGTSLTEQILASHPSVFGAGEVGFWNGAFNSFEAARARDESVASLAAGIAAEYLGRLTALSPAALRVIDKRPANFLYAGLIHGVFPRARIIHMQRHPLDTCLSIYFQNFFNMGPYAHDFDSLAHYYREYVRVMDHWRAVLPATALLEVPYEALIADQETWTRRMLEFIGVPWDPKCLNFHETERVVMTASRWQVRQKISGGSAGRWRHYEKHLGPLRQLLDLVDTARQSAATAAALPTADAATQPASGSTP